MPDSKTGCQVRAGGLFSVFAYAPAALLLSLSVLAQEPLISASDTVQSLADSKPPSEAEREAALQAQVKLDEDDVRRIERLLKNLSTEASQINAAAEREENQLADAERNLVASEISAAMLEQARLDVASLRSQRNSLNTRLLSRQDGLRSLKFEIDRAQDRVSSNDTLNNDERAALQASLSANQQQLQAVERLIDQLSELQQLMDDRLATGRQKLALLQSRFELPDLNTITAPPSSKHLQIRREIDYFLEQASKLRSEAASLTDTGTATLAQKRLLEVKAQAAEERAEYKQLDLKLQRSEHILTTLQSFTQTASTPLRVLRAGTRNVEQLADELTQQQTLLDRRHDILEDQLKVTTQQGDIASGGDETLQQRLDLLAELVKEADARKDSTDALLGQAEAVAKDYQRAVVNRSQVALFERNEWPTDAHGWKALAANLARLPNRVARGFLSSGRRLTTALNGLMDGDGIVAILAGLALLIGGFWGYRKLKAAVVRFDADDSRSLEVPLRILQQNWFWLLIPFTLGVVGYLLQLDLKSLTLLLTPLLIWPLVNVAVAFATYFVDTLTPDLDKEQTKFLIREARWVITLTAVLAAFLVIAQAVALSPMVISALEGISMLCLLLIAIPLVHLRRLVISGAKSNEPNSAVSHSELVGPVQPKPGRSLASRIVSFATLVLVATLVVSALIGLAGYVNLAWTIARYIAVSVAVLMAWMFVRSGLQDYTRHVDGRLTERDSASAAFWRQCVLAPAYGLAIILLTFAAFWLLYLLFGWNAETPIMQAIPTLFGHTLFKVGDTEIQFSNFVVAALIVFIVFRAASWSREVSFRFAFKKIGDSGIRNSLSTFVQYTVVVVGLMVALRTIGLNLTALSVFAGALGVGIGFGMQQIVVNFISGILLLIERPLATTDLVNVDKYEGEVTHIGIRSLTVKTFDAQEVIIPNSAVITKPFTNWTRSDDVMRTVLMIGISYDDDPEEAIRIISKIVLSHEATLDNPGAKITFWEFADSAQIIRVHLFTRIRGAVGRLDVRSQLLLSIRSALASAGMTIPYPQRDVHIHKAGQLDGQQGSKK